MIPIRSPDARQRHRCREVHAMPNVLLDRNENHYGPAPACLEVLRNLSAETLFNYTRDFQKGYYSALSQRLAEIHDVDEKLIVLGYGCEDILKQAVHHWLRPGERCFVPAASWWYYRAIADEVEGVTIKYPLIETETEYRYDIDHLKELHRNNPARLLLVASPNNPTGNRFDPDRLPELLEHFRDATVVLDEAYWGFAEQPADTAQLADEHPNLLILRTFSKLHGLAGVRIGYGIAGKEAKPFLKFAARYLGYNRISELLALAALDADQYYADVRRRMAADRTRLCLLLRGFPGVRAYDSVANFVLARFPERVVAPLKSALDRRGIALKFLSDEALANCARITLGTESENAELAAVLGELLPGLLRP
jgi:histidinol-phosphate aminotransferase